MLSLPLVSSLVVVMPWPDESADRGLMRSSNNSMLITERGQMDVMDSLRQGIPIFDNAP